MKCQRGIYLEKRNQRVPCGKCMFCRIRERQVWACRILLEASFTPTQSYFVTLTMDEENVPRTREGVQTLRKRDVMVWQRQVKRKHGPFRYFTVGEYGNKSKRAHYHMALFPRSDSQAARIIGEWKAGWTSSYPLAGKTASYIARYTTKKLTSPDDHRLEDGQEPEFILTSRDPGLGFNAVRAIVAQYRTAAGQNIIQERGDVERTIRIGGRKYPLGDYLLTKIRKELGIPLLESERLCHPNYEAWHVQEDPAEWDEEAFVAMEEKHRAEEKRKALSYKARRI